MGVMDCNFFVMMKSCNVFLTRFVTISRSSPPTFPNHRHVAFGRFTSFKILTFTIHEAKSIRLSACSRD